MFVSPLAAMGLVVRTRSVESLPLSTSAGMLLSSLVWSIYGVYVADFTILVPNVIGASLAFVQLALFARYSGTDESKVAAARAASRDAAAGADSPAGEAETVPLTAAEGLRETELAEQGVTRETGAEQPPSLRLNS